MAAPHVLFLAVSAYSLGNYSLFVRMSVIEKIRLVLAKKYLTGGKNKVDKMGAGKIP